MRREAPCVAPATTDRPTGCARCAARRRLCASYDLFLSDDRILPLLPKLLGKAFFKKKKQPIPVDLTGADWGAAVARATGGTYFFTSSGGCSAVRAARAALSRPRHRVFAGAPGTSVNMRRV